MNKVKLMQGDNIESLKKLPENSIDSIVTDPPYGLSFMGKKWDYDVPSVEFWKEVYRVLKPGGHILSFGGTRTYHRMTVNIEDAGFEIRDQIMWLYGSGFPKSHNIGKSVDKLQGNDREVVGDNPNHRTTAGLLELGFQDGKASSTITKGQSPYEGWGTALKPANEPICVARKPLSEKTIAENVIKWGTGGINIDGCRVGYTSEADKESAKPGSLNATGENSMFGLKSGNEQNSEGRFPANIILDEIAAELLDEQSGYLKSGEVKPHHKKNKTANGYQGSCYGKFQNEDTTLKGYGDGGGASRFFYQAKVSKAERNMGLDGFEEKESISQQVVNAGGTGAIGNTNPSCQECKGSRFDRGKGVCKCDEPVWNIPKNNTTKNIHPTVKPVALMSYLCRLVTPPNGIVCDPFMGSGSTGISAQLEGFRFVGMEMDSDYFKIAEARINDYEQYKKFIK